MLHTQVPGHHNSDLTGDIKMQHGVRVPGTEKMGKNPHPTVDFLVKVAG